MFLWFGIFSLAACCYLNITVKTFFNYFFFVKFEQISLFLLAGPLIFEFESYPWCRLVSVPSSVSLHILLNACIAGSLGNCTPCWGTTETKAKWLCPLWLGGLRFELRVQGQRVQKIKAACVLRWDIIGNLCVFKPEPSFYTFSAQNDW